MNINLQMYDNAISFTAIMLNKHKASSIVDKMDIVHNVIINEMVNELNYKSLIVGEIKQAIAAKNEVTFDECFTHKLQPTNRVCIKCGETYNDDYFKAGFNHKTNTQQYRNTCCLCYGQTRKRYPPSEQSKANATAKRKARREKERLLYGKTIDPTRNERVKRFWQKHKEQLSDTYIIKLLKDKRKKVEITQQMIEEKRHSLQIKSNIKFTKKTQLVLWEY